MDEKTAYWASVVLGAMALLLLIVNMCLINGNRRMQEEINQRQATINGGVTLNQIDNFLVKLLADSAVKNNDSDTRNLLAEQGLTIPPSAKGEPKEKESAKDGKESKKKSSQ